MKILIADDDRTSNLLLQRVLTNWGYECVEVADGRAALQTLARDRDIRMAILDWEMPGLTGPAVCKLAQKFDHFVYLILLTARQGEEDITHALGQGASDYVTKPFHQPELKARIQVGERLVNLQTQLLGAQKLESIGRLAAGIAHEINTPIQYVGDNVNFLMEAFDDILGALRKYEELYRHCERERPPQQLLDEVQQVAEAADLEFLAKEVPQAIDQARDGVGRISGIVLAMKSFSHPGSEEKTAVDLNECLTSTFTVCRNEWKYVAELESDLCPDLPPLLCYPGELNQVFLNIIVNAAQAIAEVVGDGSGGKGKISVKNRRDGDWIDITISDTGGGIPESIRHRIFDPFFTTKEPGEGTGQGLAIAHSVVVGKHAGELKVTGKPGEGTTFVIRLPLVVEADEDSEAIG